VEIAAGDNLFLLREDEGVICGGVNFPLQNLADPVKNITAGAMHLGNTAQGVGVLCPQLTGLAGKAAAIHKLQQIGSALYLTWVGADIVN